jgi:CheY-like chemotaxis protein
VKADRTCGNLVTIFKAVGICAEAALKICTQEMRGNSQLLRSVNSRKRKNLSMKTTLMLLLTNDSQLEEAVAEALLELGGVSHLTRDAGNALQTVCGVHDLDLAVIDFEDGPHGMTLLGAISTLREDLPMIVITHDDDKHAEALAYANGAAACFPKPVSVTHLASAIRELQRLKPELTPA